MSGPFSGMDLRSMVELAAGAVVSTVQATGVCGVLVRGDATDVVCRQGFPDGLLHGLRVGGSRFLVEELARAGEPVRLEAADLPDDLRDLHRGMISSTSPALAAFPLFSEGAVGGFLTAPLPAGAAVGVDDRSWRLIGRALEAVQLAAAAEALGCALDRTGAGLGQSLDGVLVVDPSGRVVLEEGLFRSPRHAAPFGSFGVELGGLPGGGILAGLRPSTCEALAWQEHLLPPVEGQGMPVALAAFRPASDRNGSGAAGALVIFARDLRVETGHPGGGRWLMGLGTRVAHTVDVLRGALVLAGDAAAGDIGGAALRGRIRRIVQEAGALVDTVLARSEPAVGAHVNPLVEDTLERCRRELRAERVRVFTFLGADVPPAAGDPVFLGRALRALVELARGSLRPGGGSLTVRTWHEDGWISVTVSDDGAGRRGYDEERIGLPLFDSDGDPRDAELRIVREVVEGAGGRLLVESRPGIWTRSTVMLRARQRAMPTAARATAQGSLGEEGGGGLAVLVVDDNPALRSVLRRFLERRGHRVTEASDGEEGLKLLETGAFDRLLVDIHMPGKDGPSFYQSLVGIAPDLQQRTIFMTGGFIEGRTEQFILETGRPAIRKPFDLGEMVRALEGA